MTESEKDTQRALAACKVLIDGRDTSDHASIMTTVEHAIATMLISLYEEPRLAAGMLNEALVPGIEQRLTLYGARKAAKG